MNEQLPFEKQSMEEKPNLIPTVPPVVSPPTIANAQTNIYIVSALIAIGIGLIGIFVWRGITQKSTKDIAATPTPTHTPSPTPIRQISALASQSGFIALDEKIASLSSSIKNYIIEDPSLSPPVLVLPLGFGQ